MPGKRIVRLLGPVMALSLAFVFSMTQSDGVRIWPQVCIGVVWFAWACVAVPKVYVGITRDFMEGRSDSRG